MDTCFLFTKHLDDTGCFCLKITQAGEIISPPLRRNFSEIATLQKNNTTIIVETSERASIFDLELPWLPERRARIAIPFALEDKLAQSVDELHFAFDKLRHQNNHYLITVISKLRIQFIMSVLIEHDIEFETITLDWFALALHELCISESTLLINNGDFKGALSGELARSYLNTHLLNQPIVFQDSNITTDLSSVRNEMSSYVWIAQQLLKSKPLNLCQGDMQHGNAFDWIQKGYQLVGLLFCVWLFSILLVNSIALYSLSKKTKEVDEKISVIYHEFFPNAKQVISPKFRINQLLGSNKSDSQAHFWFVLNQFSKAIKDTQFTLEQISYQNKTLSVKLIATDFSSLEELENKLKKLHLKVIQTQASTHDQRVVATLELM